MGTSILRTSVPTYGTIPFDITSTPSLSVFRQRLEAHFCSVTHARTYSFEIEHLYIFLFSFDILIFVTFHARGVGNYLIIMASLNLHMITTIVMMMMIMMIMVRVMMAHRPSRRCYDHCSHLEISEWRLLYKG